MKLSPNHPGMILGAAASVLLASGFGLNHFISQKQENKEILEREKALEKRLSLEIDRLKKKIDEMEKRKQDFKDEASRSNCGALEEAWIEVSKRSLTDNLQELEKTIEEECEQRMDCPEDSSTFWSDFKQELDQAYIFCPPSLPKTVEGFSVEGTVVEFPSMEKAGAYAIVGIRVNFIGPCTIEKIMSHELAHLASGQSHEASRYTDDWIYLLGEEAEELCEQTR